MYDSLYAFVIAELRDRRGKWREIERATGLSYSTIAKISSGAIHDPGIKKMEVLAKHFGYEFQLPNAA